MKSVQICLALKHAHDRLILHRDLKPQNIFLTRKNLVRLGDFGISRVLTNTQSVASTCVGTPLYLAPELCEGKEYKDKGDVWSLGAILYELCVLQPPFTANTMPALVMRICNDAPKPIEGDFCGETKSLAFRLLCKDPDERPRVHDILAMDFMKSRIENFLDPAVIVDEFSHTIIREEALAEGPAGPAGPAGRLRPASGGHGSASAVKGRARPAPPGANAGATKRAPSRCAPPGAGASVAPRPAAACRSRLAHKVPEETSAQRAQRLKEDDERRLAQREQMRRDRLAYGKVRGGAGPSATEIVEKAVSESQPMAEAHDPAATAVSAAALKLSADTEEADDGIRRALEDAFPGSRLLTQEERRGSHDLLLKRQQEVIARVQSSQVKGEQGRMALNEAQRELLDISRIRAATSKRYVLLRVSGACTFAPLPPGTVVAGVPIEEIGHIDEDATEADDDFGEEDEAERQAENADGVVSACELAANLRSAVDPATRVSTTSGCVAPSVATTTSSSTVSDAERRSGGIKFSVTLEDTLRLPPQAAFSRATAVHGDAHPAATLNVPAQLFGVGRPLSSKVERLRAHLQEKLGSRAAFERVFDFVSREESGEQQSGEREEILLFLADQRDLLPLMHTLLYLEEAMG